LSVIMAVKILAVISRVSAEQLLRMFFLSSISK